MTTKNYLIHITLGPKQKEHAQLPQALHTASQGRYKAIPTSNGLLVFMESDHWADSVAGHFGKVLLNQDSYLVVELGASWWVSQNLATAQGWLHTHLPKRR